LTDSNYGTATLVGEVSCDYDIRVGRPDGSLFAAGTKGSFSAATGKWVTDGLLFYLQMRGSDAPNGTLAVAKAKVKPAGNLACTVQNFLASPNPIRTNGRFGTTTLTGSADCAFDIRVNAPNGSLFTTGQKGTFSAQTDEWVTDGMTFYLQAQGDETDNGTLAVVAANVLPSGPSSCTVQNFSADPNPIRTGSQFGIAHLTGTVDCPYDVRVGSADGALFATGEKGSISLTTGAWVRDGLSFYLQEHGDTTEQGTLATVSIGVTPGISAPPCKASGFGFSSSPIRASGLYGSATLTGTVDCSYDIRLFRPNGPLFASGDSGPISAGTGNWITEGMVFYLQQHGDTTAYGTLSRATAKLAVDLPSCPVDSFSADPISGDGFYGSTTLSGKAGCSYEIHVGAPDGPLFAVGSAGAISASTQNWVADGTSFFLQADGSTTLQGTLAIATAKRSH
jgi:hypothetical protein